MTEQKPPERIWYGVYKWQRLSNGDAYPVREITWCDHAVNENDTEYVRADIADRAREDALREAERICDEERYNTNLLTSNPPQSAAAVGARNRIRALIPQEPDEGDDR